VLAGGGVAPEREVVRLDVLPLVAWEADADDVPGVAPFELELDRVLDGVPEVHPRRRVPGGVLSDDGEEDTVEEPVAEHLLRELIDLIEVEPLLERLVGGGVVHLAVRDTVTEHKVADGVDGGGHEG